MNERTGQVLFIVHHCFTKIVDLRWQADVCTCWLRPCDNTTGCNRVRMD